MQIARAAESQCLCDEPMLLRASGILERILAMGRLEGRGGVSCSGLQKLLSFVGGGVGRKVLIPLPYNSCAH